MFPKTGSMLAFAAFTAFEGVVVAVRNNVQIVTSADISPISDNHVAEGMGTESSIDSVPYNTQADIGESKRSHPVIALPVFAIPSAQHHFRSEDDPRSMTIAQATFEKPTLYNRQMGGYQPQTSSMTLAASLSSTVAPAESSNLMEAASALHSEASIGAAYASQVSVARSKESAAEYSMGAAYVSWAADVLEASAKGQPLPPYPTQAARSSATLTQTLVGSLAVAAAILGLAVGL